MALPRLEYWSELLFPSPGDLADPEIEAASPALAGGLYNYSTWEVFIWYLLTSFVCLFF